jgi:hypothetical protein
MGALMDAVALITTSRASKPTQRTHIPATQWAHEPV